MILKKILHVEDDPDILTLVKVSLERSAKVEVRTCDSAAEALAIAPEFQPDLILLDVMMPDMDGIDAYAEFRKIEVTSETPIVYLTAKSDLDSVTRMRDLGASDIILKPFNPMRLNEKIDVIWQKHKLGMTNPN
ncbi:MAG: response regulator [Proteobacteria bacterium]|nr:response regulator [Pseudomonadota bacterium]